MLLFICLFVCTCPGTANSRKRRRSTADTADSYQTRLEALTELRREELEVKKQQTENRKQETGVDEAEGRRRKGRQRRRQKGETDDDEILYGTHEETTNSIVFC